MSRPNQKEQGTVLLTTLLIMTVMAAITVALMDDIQLSVKRTINVQAYAQADWQADGAEDFVLAYLENDFADLAPEAKALLLQSRTPQVLPTPTGSITLTLKDASQCFNLNAVVNEAGARNDAAWREFAQLGQLLGLPENQATSLSSALVDWEDADQQQSTGGAEDGTYLRKNPPYRTADTALRGPEELRAVEGMDEELWELFKPFVCTGGTGVLPLINVNSLTAERTLVLAAALSGEQSGADMVPAAQAILRDRPLTGYASPDEYTEVLAATGIEGAEARAARLGLDVTSVFVEVVTQVGPAERVRSYRYDSSGGGLQARSGESTENAENVENTERGVSPEGGEGVDTASWVLTYRGWGRETFRPEIETLTDANSETEVDAR